MGVESEVELKIGELIDFWKCCFFNVEALVTVLPAFLLAGAVMAFVPPNLVLRYLGKGARPWKAYGMAAASGYVLSICSCNIVPLFIGIRRRGAGLGPAITFLYAGPAINLLSLIFVAKIVGPWMGIIRGMLVPIIAVLVGLLMAWLFEGRGEERAVAVVGGQVPNVMATYEEWPKGASLILFILFVLMVVGGVEVIPLNLRLAVGGLLLLSLVVVALKGLGLQRAKEWMWEVWALMRMVLPVLIPIVFAIALFAQWVPIKWTVALWGRNDLRSVLNSSLFGSLMYFPILTEAPFVKALIKDLGMAPGPALSMLLTAPGLSLAGMAIIWRELRPLRLLTYWLLIVILSTFVGWIFGVTIGNYVCPCMLASPQ